MPDTSRRLILRVIIKLLSLTALIITGYVFFSSYDEKTTSSTGIVPLRIELNTLQLAQPQRLEWAGGPLQLIRMSNNAQLYLFYDRGGNLNCPLSWQPPKSSQAPHQPWPGGFRDQCSGVWYRYDGQVLPGQRTEQNLQAPPYRLINRHLLEIGVNGDNAAPAN